MTETIQLTPDLISSARKKGLTTTQLIVLLFLAGDSVTMSAAARHISVSTAAMTGLADALERKGLLFRKPARHDRRKHLLTATPAGLTLLGMA